MSELARRVLFSVVAAPIAIAIVYLGGAPLATLLGILAGIGAWEFFRIARAAGAEPLETTGIVLSTAVPLIVHATYLRVLALPLTVVVLAILALLGAVIWLRGPGRRPLLAVASTLLGIVYTGVMLSYGYAIRYHDYAVGALAGTALVAFPLILTWGSDTGAYFVGRAFGRRKLIPSVSPGKTVAGAIGALATAMLITLVYVPLVLRPAAQLALAPWAAVLFGLAVSAAAQIGDLAESLFKREAGVKNSSELLPGHGGVLDRFDSLIFVLPVAYALFGFLLIPAPR